LIIYYGIRSRDLSLKLVSHGISFKKLKISHVIERESELAHERVLDQFNKWQFIRISMICSKEKFMVYLTGFENANYACCYVSGRFGGLVPCGPPSKVCEDRSKYVFWDPYHPSDATNVIIARRLMDGDSNDITPMNITQLVLS
jgi:hypothetical protein